MGQYYELIMGQGKNSFSHSFNACWSKQLDQMPKPYADALQLRIGNQLRPKLTCWGAAFNTCQAHELNLSQISEVASYVEMLHKASIIIDDMIDMDDARHGKKAFHAEFGRNEAVIFALALLGKGAAGINDVFQHTRSSQQSATLYSQTIYRMAVGCLEELDLDPVSRYDTDRIRRIIDLETISLIKNSLLLGYWSNCGTDQDIERTVVEIGKNCGYIFQILNDLEPFSSAEKNSVYKGAWNVDMDRDRKNIAVAYIYGAACKREKHLLASLTGDELFTFVLELYKKYSIFDEICDEARGLEYQTDDLITALRQSSKPAGCLDDFKNFVHEMVEICFSKLG
ncbi:MAG: hypothetical protein HDT27_01775 [Subdoligranulum sp.]|nr:hypothetical protein [Subdoligranulum sp.]